MAERHLRSTPFYQLNYQDNPIGTPLEWNEYFQAIKDSPIITGTNTSVTTGKLIDSGASFVPAKVGDLIVNTTSGNYARITAKDSATQLTLDSDIFSYTLQDYEIYRKPNVPIGWKEADGQTVSDADSPFNGVALSYPRSFKRIVSSSTYTATADDSEIIVNPTADTTITVDPAVVSNLDIKVRHLGYGLMQRGDCEDTTPPRLPSQTTDDTQSSTFTRSSDFSRSGTYSYKWEKTATGTAFHYMHETGFSLKGLIAGNTYTFTTWIYVPSVGGPASLSNLQFRLGEPGAVEGTDTATEYDKWQKLSITIPVSSGATDINAGIVDTTSAANTIAYFDDFQIYRHYDVNVETPSGKDIGGKQSVLLESDDDFLQIQAVNNEHYLMKDYYAHGQNEDGTWERRMGTQTCRNVMYTAADNQNFNWTYPKSFLKIPFAVGQIVNSSSVYGTRTGVGANHTNEQTYFVFPNNNPSNRCSALAQGEW